MLKQLDAQARSSGGLGPSRAGVEQHCCPVRLLRAKRRRALWLYATRNEHAARRASCALTSLAVSCAGALSLTGNASEQRGRPKSSFHAQAIMGVKRVTLHLAARLPITSPPRPADQSHHHAPPNFTRHPDVNCQDLRMGGALCALPT